MDTKKIDSVVEKYLLEKFPMNKDTLRLRNVANYDLYFGLVGDCVDEPAGIDDGWIYPGFSSACDTLRAYADELPSELWVDVDCDCVMENEPEEEDSGETDENGEPIYYEPVWESIYHYDRRDILRAIFGRELPSYL
jgi:hypothetical protein